MARRSVVSPSKAKKILSHGSVRGHKLTPRQRRMFGARAGGAALRKGRVSTGRLRRGR